jgi:hypothetical protein
MGNLEDKKPSHDGIMMGEWWWGLWEFELDWFCSELSSVMRLDIGGFEVCSYLKVILQVHGIFALETATKRGSILGQ